MIKIKWFILTALFMCSGLATVLYCHRQIMLKTFGELAYINQAVNYAAGIKEDESEIIVDEIRRSVEIGGNRNKDVAVRLKAEQVRKLSETLIRYIDELNASSVTAPRGVFTVVRNHQVFVAEEQAIRLYQQYSNYLDSLNHLCTFYDDDDVFFAPDQQKFIQRFEHIPLAISQSLLTELKFQIRLDEYQAVDWLARRMGGSCLVRFSRSAPDTVVIVREVHHPF